MVKNGCRKTNEEFILEIQSKFGEKYDLSKVRYINNKTPITLICPRHGEFNIIPQSLLNGQECKECLKEEKSREKHKQMAKYISKISSYEIIDNDFQNVHDKITCICQEHGEFRIPIKRLLKGCGCPSCSQKKKHTSEEIIQELTTKYGNNFIYDKVDYTNAKTKVKITCPKHGDILINPRPPFPNNPCQKCGSKLYSTYDFIKRCKKINFDLYDYSSTIYIGSKEDVEINCPKHGKFVQKAYAHLRGQGCPKCNQSKLEEDIINLLKEKNIEYIIHDRKILNGLELDFYLPQYNIAIECQGVQHFEPIEYFGGEKTYKSIQERDNKKRELCKEKGIKIIFYSNLGIKYPYQVEEKIQNISDLLK